MSDRVSFLDELRSGRLRWDLIHPFPRQDPADLAAGDSAAARLRDLLAEQVDPDELDSTRTLPRGLVPALHAGGFLAMTVPSADGGLGLSAFNTFRLLETAAARSASVGMLLSWQNTLGIGAFLELIGPGPLRDLVVARVAAGAVLGFGDTEPAGAANAARDTVAVPTGDGSGYLLSGVKLFTGNGSMADLITVSATVRGAPDGGTNGGTNGGAGGSSSGERIGMFLVDTASDGFTPLGRHDLVGLNGSPLGAFRMDRVRVPAQHAIISPDRSFRALPQVARLTALARMFITVTPPLAAARSCLSWSREFLGTRRVNGRALSSYESMQHRLATSVAEVFAVDSVVRWCLLGGGLPLPELTAAKNIGTVTSWRVIERTISLLGGEGAETAQSKASRGAPALPVERAWRDARSLRIAGGVDFNIDMRAAWSGIFEPIYADGAGRAARDEPPPAPQPPAPPPPAPQPPALAALSAANRRNQEYVGAQVGELRSRCLRLAAAHPPGELAERQETLITVNRLADELFTMSVVLARVAGRVERAPGDGGCPVQGLAEVYCAGARVRLARLWAALDAAGDRAGYAGLCQAWMDGNLAVELRE